MNRNKWICLLTFSMLFASCSEKDHIRLLNGKYEGTFHHSVIAPVAVELAHGNTYSSSGNPDRIPAGGSGTFSILENKMIEFKDKNMWTADFDWNLILTGRFNYEIKGDSLILIRYFEPCAVCSKSYYPSYQYRLKRID
jgi:hypothetical protein